MAILSSIRSALFIAFFACPLMAAVCSTVLAEDVDFRVDVAAILSKHCVRCHGDSKSEGDVNLSRRGSAIGSDKDSGIIVPRLPDDSLLIEVVSGENPRMPKGGSPLSEREIDVLRRWIEQGAAWPEDAELRDDPQDWWSLRPLERPKVPTPVSGEDPNPMRIRNPIDAFVNARRIEKGLRGNPEADRRTLIRRLYFDLVGLPPSPEEVDQFVGDSSPNAYEELVEQLLASPRYGERWARHWLDAVHYGDTHGYDKDKLRPNAWPYRDYVIRSLNQDKPYGQFVREQIAGDHFYPDTRDGVEGLGMLAAGPFDFVGQIEVSNGTIEKARVKNIDRDDMVSTVMNTFVSMTAQCARCHDHKFDPIQQKEYYQLQAVFAAVDRADRSYDEDPKIASTRRILLAEREKLQFSLETIQRELKERGGAELASIDQQIELLQKPNNGVPPEFGYHSAITIDSSETKWVQVDLGHDVSIARIGLAAPNDDFAGIGPGFGFPVRFRIEGSKDAEFSTGVVSMFDSGETDFANPGVAPRWFEATGDSIRYVRITATQLAPRSNDYIFALSELMVFDESGKNIALGGKVSALDSIEAPIRWGAKNLVDGIYPGRDLSDSEGSLEAFRTKRVSLVQSLLGVDRWEDFQSLQSQVQKSESQIAGLPKPKFVYAAATEFAPAGSFVATGGKSRPIHILARGSETAPLELVSPAALHCVSDLPGDWTLSQDATEREHRGALAEWIVHSKNPLTWRSVVNRIWYHHFGRGIVESLNDFGRMGSDPTHPELLDWLACEMRDGEQSFKDIHRWIVLSSTYRQSSAHSPENESIDAGNLYLWRMNRRKLDAESVRDSILQTSGKLRLDAGGPGYNLFGLIDDHSPHYLYDQHDPDDPRGHRRAIYRFIVRSVPDPWMSVLDCADATVLVDRRNETLTALQALAMLNNPFVLRMSDHFADRVESKCDAPSDRLAYAFRLAFQREPTERERAILLELVREHGLPQVCRSLFNANEFIFVD